MKISLKKPKNLLTNQVKKGLMGTSFLTVLSSSVAEQVTVNHLVVGSTPT